MAEYDALPDLGHACGHNLSGVASITAAIALSKILSKNHFDGTILVMGTPGEELYSGKVSLIRAGAFQNVDVAMMVHMFDRNVSAPISLALDALDFHFRGKAAHAAGAPHEGVNALNGVIQTFVGIDALRQHIRDDARIHGIITHGGVAPNIVPEKASARFYVRARARQYLDEVTEKVKNCARGAALATGAQVEIKNFEASVDDLISNRSLVEAFERNWSYFTPDIQKAGAFGSTDVGNVSHVVPTIQPLVSITPGIMPHTREFAEATAGEKGHRALAIGAKTLAMTALDLFTNPELLGRIKEDFSQMPGR
jgi:amidohydrolase